MRRFLSVFAEMAGTVFLWEDGTSTSFAEWICYTLFMLYIDVYFIVNWWMDLLLLSVAAVWRKSPIGILRLFGAASAGAAGACLLKGIQLYAGQDWMGQIGTWLLLAAMTRLAFGRLCLRYWVFACGQVLFLAWLAAGILDFVYYQSNMGQMLHGILYGERGAPENGWLFWWTLVLSGGGSMILQLMGSSRRAKSPVCSVTMEFRDKKVEVQGLLDSGNRLFTHLGVPVTIVEREVMHRLLEPDEWEGLCYWSKLGSDYPERMLQFQLVVFHSVGKRQGVMPAITIDRMVIHRAGGDRIVNRPVIGCSESILSEENAYQVILHSSFS